MTDNEIIKALEYCVSVNNCDNCKKPTPRICTTFETKDFLDLINRQKAEIERLDNTIYTFEKHFEFVKAEAVRKFAERLKEKYSMEIDGYYGEVVFTCDIDDLVKEMVGDSK